jgi:anti-sigma regulatory factor (Ser/Thr protein kinase)
MYHGNLELPKQDLANVRRLLRRGESVPAIELRREEEEYKNRRVRIAAVIKPDEARIVIQDDGVGFHPNSIPEREDPSILKKTGRGLVLMSQFTDALMFNELGNEVVMVKKKRVATPK